MSQVKKPGRPPKKREWKQEQRFNWTVDFFKHPSVHTFIHMRGIEAVLPEFERLLLESNNECANKQTQANLLGAKAKESLGVEPVISIAAPSPAPLQEFIQPAPALAPIEVSKPEAIQVTAEQKAPKQEHSVETTVVQRVIPPTNRRSILDDD